MSLRRLAPLFLVVTLVSACQSHTRIGVGAATMIVGAATAVAASDHDGVGPSEAQLAGGVVALLGAVLLATGVVGVLVEDDDKPIEALARAPVAETAASAPASAALRSREENRLAMQTSLSARAGHCEAARATAKQLAAIDPDLYSRLLATDEAVARCSSR